MTRFSVVRFFPFNVVIETLRSNESLAQRLHILGVRGAKDIPFENESNIYMWLCLPYVREFRTTQSDGLESSSIPRDMLYVGGNGIMI